MSGFTILTPDQHEFKPPSWRPEEPVRRIVELPLHANMQHSRAHLWRYPPGATGRLHIEHSQEEVFVVVEGNPAVMLGDPPDRHDAPHGTLVVVEPGTPLQVAERQRRRRVDLRLRRAGRVEARSAREGQ